MGMERSEQCHRPMEPPRRPRRAVQLPFPVSEDAANPVNERPGMTNVLLIKVETDPSAIDIKLVRRAVWSIHPLFETWTRVDLFIEVPASKIARPRAWIQVVIEGLLPILHAVNPIRSVQFGREPRLHW